MMSYSLPALTVTLICAAAQPLPGWHGGCGRQGLWGRYRSLRAAGALPALRGQHTQCASCSCHSRYFEENALRVPAPGHLESLLQGRQDGHPGASAASLLPHHTMDFWGPLFPWGRAF